MSNEKLKKGMLTMGRPFLWSCFSSCYPSMPKSDRKENVHENDLEASKGEEEKEVALFSVTGMTCSACAGSVEKAVKRLPGIYDVSVDVLNNRAQVIFNPLLVSEDIIQEAIEDAGFQAASVKHELKEKSELICRIRIKGMTCTSCSSTIESALQSIRGVQRALVALATEEAEIQYNPKLVDATQFVEVVEDTGFEAVLISTGEDMNIIHLKLEGTHTEKTLQMIESLLHALPGVDVIIIDPVLQKISISYRADHIGPRNFIDVIESSKPGHFRASIYPDGGINETHRHEEIMQYHHSFLRSLIFTIPVFLTSMVFMYIPGIHRVLESKVVNSLTVGVIFRWTFSTPVQFIIGRKFYIGSYKALRHGAANMDVLIALGTNVAYFFSVYSMLKASISANFVCTDFFETSSMLISFILLGKYLEVVAKGKTSEAIVKLMNLAPETAMLLIYGEDSNMVSEREIDSRLVQKNDVIKILPGGNVASDGYVIWGNSHVNESMITGESLPVSKGKGDRVIGGTVNENGMLHVKVTHTGSETALSQIVRLVESAQLAKAPVQKLADQISKYFVPLVNCIVFDKTGTLTIGKPVVVSTRLLMNIAIREFYEYIAAAEVNSEHPLAKAIVDYAMKLRDAEENYIWPEAKEFISITGHGVKATVKNIELIIGNKSLIVDSGINIPEEGSEILMEAEEMAQTGIVVSMNHEVVGIIAISDPLKPEAADVISILKSMNVKSIMVTGDNWGTARAIAKEVGIDSVVAEAKPDQKVQKVKELQKSGLTVAMVGDGINDSAALVSADVGMAIGAGTDIAIEAADIVLMKSNLEDVVTAIDLSRKTFYRIRMNYIWALGYNMIGIPVAAGAFFPSTRLRLPPWMAGAAMAASSVSVVMCSLLLKNYRRPKKLDALQFRGITAE